MEHFKSSQFTAKGTEAPKPSGVKPLNYGYGGVNQLLTMQIKQEQLTQLRKKNSKL
jgi:hypothetical protein